MSINGPRLRFCGSRKRARNNHFFISLANNREYSVCALGTHAPTKRTLINGNYHLTITCSLVDNWPSLLWKRYILPLQAHNMKWCSTCRASNWCISRELALPALLQWKYRREVT